MSLKYYNMCTLIPHTIMFNVTYLAARATSDQDYDDNKYDDSTGDE